MYEEGPIQCEGRCISMSCINTVKTQKPQSTEKFSQPENQPCNFVMSQQDTALSSGHLDQSSIHSIHH